MTDPAHEKATSPHAGHTMPEMHVAHDRHAGHFVAMFRDKLLAQLRSHNSSSFLVK